MDRAVVEPEHVFIDSAVNEDDSRADAGSLHVTPLTLWQRRRGLWTLQAIARVLLSLALWAGCLRLFSLHTDFPSAYHPDEGSKAEQLVSGRRNFNHPQLMLEAAAWVLPTPLPADEEQTVRQARVVSAAFGAGAAVLMAWAGAAAAGWAGFLCVGLAIGLCPPLLAHAHFLKEDAALVFGIAAVLCAGAWTIRFRRPGPQLWMILLLGVACGVAAAGKYCGAVMLLPAVMVAVGSPLARRHWGLALAGPVLVIVFAAVTWAAIDWRVVTEFNGFLDGFGREQEHSMTGHQGLTMDRPTGFFVDLVRAEAMPHVKGLALLSVPLIGVMLLWRGRRDVAGIGFGMWLVATAVIYSVMLAYSAIPFYRYTMPVSVMGYAFAGLSATWAANLLPTGHWRAAAIALAAGGIGVTQGVRCVDYTRQFADDSRDAVRAWAWSDVPAGTIVATDFYVMPFYARPGDAGPLAQRLRIARMMPPFGGKVADLRRGGVKYVITAGTNSERFLSPFVRSEDGNAYLTRTAAFYREVQTYPVAWSRVARHPMRTFANPDIVVYDISKEP